MEEAKKLRSTSRRLFTLSLRSAETLCGHRPTIDQLDRAYEKVEAAYDKLVTVNEDIISKLPDDCSETELNENMNYVEEIDNQRAQITEHIQKIKTVIQKEQKNDLGLAPSEIGLPQPRVNTKSQLERLRIQTFAGNIREYPSWKLSFLSAMNKYAQDKEEQLQRIKDAVLPPARKDIIHCLTVDSVIEILDQNYGNPDELMSLLLKDVKSYRSLRNGNSSSLKAFASEIRCFIVRMTDLGKTNDLKSDYLVLDLLDKLTVDDQYKYKSVCFDKNVPKTLETLVSWLGDEAQLRSNLTDDSSRKYNRTSSSSNSVVSKPQHIRPCLLKCNNSHLLKNCPVFKNMKVVDKWNVVKANKCCFCCLRPGHQTKNCFEKKNCEKPGCNKNHNLLLHENLDQVETVPKTLANSCFSSCGNLPVLRAKIYDDFNVSHLGTVLLDCGSQRTWIRKGFANRLRLVSQNTLNMHICLATGYETYEKSSTFNFKISCLDNDVMYDIQANSLKNVCGDLTPIDRQELYKFPHLSGLVDDLYCEGGPVDVLIGTDFPFAFKELGQCAISDIKAPIAKQSPLGWVLLGALSNSNVSYVNYISLVDEPNIAKFFEVETLGIKPTKHCTCKESELMESAFIDNLQSNTTVLPDGRIQMKMPWKKGHPNLPDSKSMALKRLTSLENRLIKTNKINLYDAEIKKLVDDGFCIRLLQEEIDWSKPYWLLPHREVERPEASSTKTRIVFDSSARVEGVCLNDALEKGPNYLNDLFKVLIGFRQEVIGYCGDIRKMFNMISIHPDDQPFHRFLWRHCDTTKEPNVYQWIRLSFGDKSSPDLACSAIQILAGKFADNYPLAKKELMSHIYMDDIANSSAKIGTSLQIIHEVQTVLESGCFQIKAWHSNNNVVDNAKDENTISVLGHVWDKENDSLKLKSHISESFPNVLTKRIVFVIIAQCWDPLGLISPSMIKYKIEMQNLWSAGLLWDDILSDEVAEKWRSLFSELPMILNFETHRSTKPPNAIGQAQLHGFADGGELGYGSCVFLRWNLDNGQIECRLVTAKPFVAPLKRKTIPRLELMGCVTLSRLVDSILSSMEMEFEKICLWSDSSTALNWIRSTPRSFKPFVGVRIAEIQESHDPVLWRYVPSGMNPADALTRGINPDQLKEWHQGPKFLLLPEHEWPVNSVVKQNVKDDSERKPVKLSVLRVDDIVNSLIERSSDWIKIRRYTAIWLRFVKNCQLRPDDRYLGNVTPEELKQAEIFLIKKIQYNFDADNKALAGVQQFKDDNGVIRANGRFDKAEHLPYDMRYPVILPRKHALVRLMLESLHRKLGHPGYKRLVDESRQKYWILGVRDIARSIYFSCLICKRRRQPLLDQKMGLLPSCRLDFNTPAFANTSLDLFGPLKVKIGRKTVDKAYGCIFACLTIRAIHVELVMEESTDHFLMALRRFSAIRGWPKFIFSDNGTNFVGSQVYLREMILSWNVDLIRNNCAEKGTLFDWKFNCPTASHMNGAVESLIKSVRKAIDGVFNFGTYTQCQWITILYEASYLVNSRPLYPSSDNVLDAPPITPNSLLLGNINISPQPHKQDIVNLRQLNNSVQHKIQLFWEQWLRHFAPNLLVRNKWYHSRDNLKVGDLCILLDPYLPRALWKLALVIEIYPSQDGHIRKVRIKTASGQYDRPVHKLCLIATGDELGATQITS